MTGRGLVMAEYRYDQFVGRRDEMAVLVAALEEATQGHGRLVMLAGEPGIGKTRLTREFANATRRRETMVLVGRCHEGEGAPAYWPWVQVIRGLVREGGTPVLRQASSGAAAQIVPELRDRDPQLIPQGTEGAHARFMLFDGVIQLFMEAAAQRPLVLVLDDLHCADAPSLLLLQFLAVHLGSARVLVLGTYRDAEVIPDGPLSEALADMVRHPHFRRIALRGLGRDDVRTFMEMATGSRPSERAVDMVYGHTEGNPFFVGEVVRLLADERRLGQTQPDPDWSPTVPQGVREAVGQRLGRLSPPCRRMLQAAAVVGRDFGLEVLERVTGMAAAALLSLLEEAERARVAVRLPVGVGQYRFVHALIRETMYELVGAADRVRLHRAVGEALEVLPGDDADSRLTDLAHHFFQAAVAGDTTKALSYAERAAKLAMTKLAYEEAALHYARALALMTESGREEDIRRCQLLLALSEAEERAGKPARAKDRLLRATDIARRCGAAEELARAALGFGGFWLAFGTVDWRLVGLLEEALATLPPDSYLLRAKVMSRLALELYYSSDRSRGAALSEEAVSLARDAGDAATVANALAARRYSLWQPEAIQQRLVDAAEIVRLAEGVGNHEVALNARSWIIRDLMELGDVNAAERETAILSRRTQELRHPAYTYVMATLKTMRALLEGRFDEVEALAVEVLAEGQKVSAQRAFQTATIHLWTVYRERARRDRAVEVEGVLQSLADVGPEFLGWRCGLATLYSLIDRKADCRREVARVVERGSEELFRDIFSGTVPAAMLTEACALLEDAEHAAALYPLFARYTGRFVVAGAGGMWYGAVARYLGLLCATMSRWDDAERHFEEALELNARIGARPFLAHTQQELAAMLVARGRSEDRARARELAGQARQTANELGMVLLNERLDTLEPTLGADGAAGQARRQASVAATAAASRTGIFRLEGEFWTIAYGDGVFRLKDSAGLRYLALLLRHPGREFLVTDLADQGRGPEVSPAVGDTRQSASLGDAGEAFDERASTAYRDRLDGIRNQLAEAESFNDHARASRLREEMDFLVQELGQGLGLHGRRRRLASHTERARVNVTRRIKGAIQKVWENDPLLGSYLTASVRTGTFCSYSPDPRIGVAWEF